MMYDVYPLYFFLMMTVLVLVVIGGIFVHDWYTARKTCTDASDIRKWLESL